MGLQDNSYGRPTGPWYGKYRATVFNNIDPKGIGRLQVLCPHFPGMKLNWAMPCVPYAGPGVGFYAMPPVDASVWIEFEGGDVNYPIWVGCFWEDGLGISEVMEAPEMAPVRQIIKNMPLGGVALELDSTPEEGGATLSVGPWVTDRPQSLTIDMVGITLQSPPSSIRLSEAGIVAAVEPGGSLTISDAVIESILGDASTTLTPATIYHQVPECSILVAAGEIAATAPPQTLRLIAEQASLGTAAANVSVTPASVELMAEETSLAATPAALAIEGPSLESNTAVTSLSEQLMIVG